MNKTEWVAAIAEKTELPVELNVQGSTQKI